MPEKIMLIDGNSIVNRAFYAIPILTNSQNEYTNGVYGFLNIFFKLTDEERPDYVAVAFDLPKPTFRHEMFAEYKGTRKGMPDELRPQLPLLKNLLIKMGIQIFELEGFEADDILGTLAKKSESQGLQVVLVSGDRDMLQLATDSIKVRIPKTKGGKTEIEDYLADDVFKLMGVTPTEYIDVKALMGDTSDNIPGVPGIGEKTALKIIQEYKTIENAIQNASNIKPQKAATNLETYAEQAFKSKKLATIVLDAPIELVREQACYTSHFGAEAFDEVKRLELKSLFSRFNEPKTENEALGDFKVLSNKTEIAEYMQSLSNKPLVAYKIIYGAGISFCCEEGKAVVVKGNNIEFCSSFLASSAKKIALDAKKDMVFLSKHGIEIKDIVFDCMVAAYILDASKPSYEYNDIAQEFLNEAYTSEEELTGKGKSKKEVYQLDDNVLTVFACNQVNVMYKAYPVMDKMIKENGQEYLYYQIEHPLIEVLKDMELYGIKVDKNELIGYDKKLTEMVDIITEEIYLLAGEQFNINSPKQLGVILFEKLCLKGSKKTKTGWSTAADILEKISGEHPIVEKILLYRTFAKLKSTYAEGLLNILDEKTHRIYSTFNQAITTTGRISSTEPNLQNIPIRLELGRELRKAFIPENDEYIFIDGDYSQIELRVLAHMSDDETLINAFKNDQDIHKLTASQVFKIPFDQVSDFQRSNAKAVNFGIVYGMGAFSLSQDLGISKREADRYIQGYFEKYPKVKKYLDETVEQAKLNGYASTIFNRRRNIPELASGNFISRSFGERVAMNMPVQGTAADIIKLAMVKVYNRFKQLGLKSRLILQVHDELLIEAHKSEVEMVEEILKEEMGSAAELKVPLVTHFHKGSSWYEAK